MACEFDDQLSGFHDDELSETGAAAVRAHLETCAACRATRQALLALGAAVRAEADAIPAPGPAEQLGALTAILGSARAPLWRRRIAVPVPVLGGLVAATLVLAALVTRAGRGHAALPASPAVVAGGGRLAIEVVKRPVDTSAGGNR